MEDHRYPHPLNNPLLTSNVFINKAWVNNVLSVKRVLLLDLLLDSLELNIVILHIPCW